MMTSLQKMHIDTNLKSNPSLGYYIMKTTKKSKKKIQGSCHDTEENKTYIHRYKVMAKKSAALKSQRDSQHHRPQNEHQTELELLGIESARRAVLVLASR